MGKSAQFMDVIAYRKFTLHNYNNEKKIAPDFDHLAYRKQQQQKKTKHRKRSPRLRYTYRILRETHWWYRIVCIVNVIVPWAISIAISRFKNNFTILKRAHTTHLSTNRMLNFVIRNMEVGWHEFLFRFLSFRLLPLSLTLSTCVCSYTGIIVV